MAATRNMQDTTTAFNLVNFLLNLVIQSFKNIQSKQRKRKNKATLRGHETPLAVDYH